MRRINLAEAGGPEVLTCVEVPDPTPGPGQVLVRTHAAAVGWPDVLVRTGTYRWQPAFPVTPGNEMSGVVEALGEGVTGFSIGQPVHVAARGSYAEKRLASAETVRALPQGVDLDAAANLGYYGLAWALLREANPRKDPRRVLITAAAGGMGSALVQVAKYEGLEVIGTVSGPEKAAFAKAAGADHVINYRTENIADRVLEITGGEGVDTIVDAVVGSDFDQFFRMLTKWGSVVLYNATGGPPPQAWFEAWRAQAAKCIALRYFSLHVYDDEPEGRTRIYQTPMRMLAQGIKPPPGARVFPLADAAEAHRYLESPQSMGRILLKP